MPHFHTMQVDIAERYYDYVTKEQRKRSSEGSACVDSFLAKVHRYQVNIDMVCEPLQLFYIYIYIYIYIHIHIYMYVCV